MCIDKNCSPFPSRRAFLSEAAIAVTASTLIASDARGQQEPQQTEDPRKALEDPRLTQEIITFKNGEDTIEGFLARPTTRGPFAAVVVVPGDFGLTEYTQVTAAQLAQSGFVALAVNTFSRAKDLSDLQQARRIYYDVMTDVLTLQDIQASIVYLKQQPFVKRGGLGVIGFCLGGRYSLLIAALSRDIAATVAFYGPLVLLKGEPDIKVARPLKIANHEMSPMDFVDWIKSPIQGHYARKDTTIPVADVERFEKALRERNARAEMFIYDTDSHFHSYHEPMYNPEAARQSWSRTIKFFKQNLR